MKTTSLFAAALLLATASFAQEVSSNATVSSTTDATVKTTAIGKAAAKADQTKTKTTQTAASEKQALSEKAKADAVAAKKTTQQNREVSASSKSSVHASAGNKDNKVSQDASISGRADVSSDELTTSARNEKNEEKAEIKEQAGSTVQKSNQLKEKTQAGLKKESGKMKPGSVTMKTQLKSNAGIRIK